MSKKGRIEKCALSDSIVFAFGSFLHGHAPGKNTPTRRFSAEKR